MACLRYHLIDLSRLASVLTATFYFNRTNHLHTNFHKDIVFYSSIYLFGWYNEGYIVVEFIKNMTCFELVHTADYTIRVDGWVFFYSCFLEPAIHVS